MSKKPGTLRLYKLGLRYYDPTHGRFTQPDPTGQDDHYLYSANNPISFSDPSGAAQSDSATGNAGRYSLRIRNVGAGRYVLTATINSTFRIAVASIFFSVISSEGRDSTIEPIAGDFEGT